MKKFCYASLLTVSMVCLLSWGLTQEANAARNLSHRLGVGFTNQIATTVDGTIPALSGKYYLSKNYATSVELGLDTRSTNSTVAAGAKLYKNLFLEDNLVFYTGAGLAMVSRNGSKFQLSAFLGSEFFFSGLPSLGLSFEAGLRGDSYSGSFAIRTTGDSFLSAGMHFYF